MDTPPPPADADPSASGPSHGGTVPHSTADVPARPPTDRPIVPGGGVLSRRNALGVIVGVFVQGCNSSTQNSPTGGPTDRRTESTIPTDGYGTGPYGSGGYGR